MAVQDKHRLPAFSVESICPGDDMKTLAVVLIAMSSLLSGCVAYEVPSRNAGHYQGGNRDRDGDGVRNSQDRRPDDPRRY